MRRTLFSALAVATALVMSPAPVAPQEDGHAPAQMVVVAQARMTTFVDRVEVLGTTRANETVRITANVTEKIVEIRFDDAQRVEAGDVLVVLDKAEEEAQLQAAEALLTQRRVAFKRAQGLAKQRFETQAQLDLRRAELEQTAAEIAAIRSRIADRIIRAPFSGIVGLRHVSVGALVAPGDLITTLDDLSVMKVDFSVPATHLTALQPGLPIVAKSQALGNREFTGEVRSIDSQIDPVTRSVLARAVLPNPDGMLRPGLLVHIELLKRPRQGIVIPEEALIPQGRRASVLVVDPADSHTVSRRAVDVGARRPGEVEIVRGLREGELVMTRGMLQVRPGQRVTIRPLEAGKP